MTVTFSALATTQPLGTFYTAMISASDLLGMCQFDYRRLDENASGVDFMGIQRPWSPKRVSDIADYTDHVDACFPTSIVISIDERCATIQDGSACSIISVDDYVDDEDSAQSVPLAKSTWIIDGQHRLKGLEKRNAENFQLPVTVFIGADEATRAALFSVVNLAQSKVSRSVVYDLFAVARERSPQKTCHKITVALDQIKKSPFHDRIKRLGAATPGRDGETLSQATVVRGIMRYITKDAAADRDSSLRNLLAPAMSAADKERLVFRPFYLANNDDAILDNLLNYFGAVQQRWGSAWDSDGRGNMINRTNGYDGFMRFFRPAYLSVTTTPKVVSQEDFYQIFSSSTLESPDFNTKRYAPGSSGAAALARDLIEQTGVPT